MANEVAQMMKNAENIRSTFGSLEEDIRRSAPGLRQALAIVDRELKLLQKGADRYEEPLAKMARGEELTKDERATLNLK